MNFTQIRYEVRVAIAGVILNRSDRFNDWTKTMMEEMIASTELDDADGNVRALIVIGGGREFCASADLDPDTFVKGRRAAITSERVSRDTAGQLTLKLYKPRNRASPPSMAPLT